MSVPLGSATLRRSDDELLRAYHESGDLDARQHLIERHLPLVRSLAGRYHASGEPLEDLVQSGCVGLIKAVDRFDTARGVRLSTYAVPAIVGEIRRHLRDYCWAVEVSRPIKELASALARADRELTSSNGRSPTIRELSQAVGADPERVVEALSALAARRGLPLDLPGPDRTEAVVERPELATQDDAYERVARRSTVAGSLKRLDERERTIVGLRFFHGLTQSEIAARIGISQMHVSRLLRGALAKAGRAAGMEAELKADESAAGQASFRIC